MRSLIARAIRRLRWQDGFTLPELLIATVLGLLIVGVATTMFIAGVRSQPNLTTKGVRV
ncbi:MAG: prepilin-type N-terminal cleavage/methylation domain-containing protein, partial [Actinomycetes bacterium]